MNILLCSYIEQNIELLEKLASIPDTSIYLSLSQSDSRRILNEIKPDIVIIWDSIIGRDFVHNICEVYPETELYLWVNHLRNFQESRLINCNPRLHKLKLPLYIPIYDELFTYNQIQKNHSKQINNAKKKSVK